MEWDAIPGKLWLSPQQLGQLDLLGEELKEENVDKPSLEDWKSRVADTIFSFYHEFFQTEDHTLDECLIDAISNTILKLTAFDPNCSPLSHYYLSAFKNNYRTMREKSAKAHSYGGLKGIGRSSQKQKNAANETEPLDKNQDSPIVVSLEIQSEDGTEKENPELYKNSGLSGNDPINLHDQKWAYNHQMTAAILNFWALLENNSIPNAGRNPQKVYRLYKMWYSEIGTQWLQMHLPCWNYQDMSRALDYFYLSVFLKTDFTQTENQTITAVTNSLFKNSVLTSFSEEPVEVEYKENGFLPAKIAQEYIVSWDKSEKTSWKKGYPSDKEITTSRQNYLRLTCLLT